MKALFSYFWVGFGFDRLAGKECRILVYHSSISDNFRTRQSVSWNLFNKSAIDMHSIDCRQVWQVLLAWFHLVSPMRMDKNREISLVYSVVDYVASGGIVKSISLFRFSFWVQSMGSRLPTIWGVCKCFQWNPASKPLLFHNYGTE